MNTGRAPEWCGSMYYPDPPSEPVFYSGEGCSDEYSSVALTYVEMSEQNKTVRKCQHLLLIKVHVLITTLQKAFVVWFWHGFGGFVKLILEKEYNV